ncbi:MAG: adenylate/guanylate cyclase domain-containing protein [Alphaproteobacteria bacterium]|jgi:TolB-like protein/class 3 adenylate cyclase/Tfp pilus assembly protein PilF|nr:adenylate/guanylate cyclase domain-containing protein [Alphaproteobacteria bacterium]MDP6812164.1 adenylate/guanylate cyclase domain-containing protein [Alphaproteobacteria bacterium]
MAADVVGYARLIRADEEGTIAALKALRADLIDPKLSQHNGRIVKLVGDGMLAEFPSVVDAVRAAVESQQAVAGHNADLPEDLRIAFRVGINLGDVVIDGDDIHGDGVNVAARLEALAEPGGVCISGSVHEQVRDRIDLPFQDLGEREVKNINRPVRVWQWVADGLEMGRSANADHAEPLPLPDKPSIAVLPFDNMSGDPEQEYFADGMAEDIIAALSRLPWFFVIARNSSFAFKGQAVDVRQLARELGVQYVLEGSVRKAGDRVRITAQLIDARNDRHLWAERYDRDLTDIFAVQDEITEKIVGAVAPEFLAAEMHRARNKDQQSLDAWDLYMRARWYRNRLDRESNVEAQQLLQKAIDLDPRGDLALGDLALSHMQGMFWGWSDSRPRSLAAAAENAERALVLNDNNVAARLAMATVDMFNRKYEDGIRRAGKAVELAPNSAEAYSWYASALTFACEWEKAIPALQKAIRLSPRDPLNATCYAVMSVATFLAARYEECIEWCERNLQEHPNAPPGVHRPMAAAYAMLDKMDEAKAAIEQLQRRIPSVTIDATREHLPIKNEDDMERLLGALRKAGLPE